MRIVQSISGVYPGSHPTLVLSRDRWDDFGFRTSFQVVLWTGPRSSQSLDVVKIMRFGMSSGVTDLDEDYADGLPDDYASLGTDYDYYEKLATLDAVGRDVLRSLRDLAVDHERWNSFKDEHAFVASLARLAPARDALHRVQRLADGPRNDTSGTPTEEATNPRMNDPEMILSAVGKPTVARSSGTTSTLKFAFSPTTTGERQFRPPDMEFDFDGPDGLPKGMIVVVGPNGTGKTTLLAELAASAFFGRRKDDGRERGEIRIEAGSIRDVIMVSYSAYDDFEVPVASLRDATGLNAADEFTSRGYVYVGLRDLCSRPDPNDRTDRGHRLKSPHEIDEEFARCLAALQKPERPTSGTPDRISLFATSIFGLVEDPSFQAILQLPRSTTPKRMAALIGSSFPKLSTGHKAVVNVVAALCLHLNPNSLVVMDEPEAHLHPPLIAALLGVVRKLLAEFKANAVVATHSPVVVQETLGRHVLVMTREEHRTVWRRCVRETFGENVAALTRDVFGLPGSKADHVGHLRGLVEGGMTFDDIEALFDGGMASPTRAQVLRLLAQQRPESKS